MIFRHTNNKKLNSDSHEAIRRGCLRCVHTRVYASKKSTLSFGDSTLPSASRAVVRGEETEVSTFRALLQPKRSPCETITRATFVRPLLAGEYDDQREYLPKFPIAVCSRGGGKQFGPQKHQEKVVRGGRRQAPRWRPLQVGSHRRQAHRQQLFCLLCQELVGRCSLVSRPGVHACQSCGPAFRYTRARTR